MVQHEYTANACQQWQATSTSDGYYRLKSKPLTVNKQSQCLVSVDGNLHLGGYEQADSEWRTEFMPNGSLRVVSRKGGSSMKVAGESYTNGDHIVEDVWKNTISQQFYFREVK
ncbi:alpha-N-arabinofuranosidase [Shewanella sp. SP1S1-7]|uniref:alpha-N-arabinofuranosidase n=1 Tax=Shewanella sp. SP1S1-7 TaxID=3063536 RepID=UPI00289072F5|nr:alpha-N-arabinofuranosidase [Shewanella sp. SP1S1-7]MDT3333783.1 alpha-N-arabinofuranosidase [Shewanella sp. SP1S1-7]